MNEFLEIFQTLMEFMTDVPYSDAPESVDPGLYKGNPSVEEVEIIRSEGIRINIR
ncbi:hypothetical protein IMZ31_20155 (plasmid) [Pontibacillus sp. ALD_SL1]|uniref:hypothetical protein n=1 Tax=Pontibacillus sp. ALD_SL1 TaxID=2777185 RepID=UPI001A95E294|nr:hypothetical protein [Pontibacillus sp. ALD_SL1]QST02865.1 hypothetical protein IMZ31_20155 [Pontibacillus sp. ALD_SL1]